MSRKVIDLSKYNSRNIINWNDIKQNVDGIIFRVGYRGYSASGTLCIDPMFKAYLENCVQYDIPFGVYWFSQEITKEESIESANYVYNLIKDYKLSYPVFYDVEYSSATPALSGRADVINSDVRTDCIIAFCEEIKRLGFVPGVYANEHWFKSIIEYNRIKNYSIWCAKYNKNSGQPEIPPTIDYDIWQYTDKGSIPGISGYVDISLDESAFILKNQQIKPNKKSIDIIAVEVIDGLWGNGKEREKALTNAGYNYNEVQSIVNDLLTITNCDMVMLRADAVYSNGKSIPTWVKNSKLFIRDIRDNGDVLISTVRTGDITGVVNKKYLVKVKL